MTRTRCLVCDRPLPPPAATGRPRLYCSTSCRRVAEFEIRRLNARLGRLEDERDRLARPSSYMPPKRLAEERAAVAALIGEATERMRALLAAEDDPTDPTPPEDPDE